MRSHSPADPISAPLHPDFSSLDRCVLHQNYSLGTRASRQQRLLFLPTCLLAGCSCLLTVTVNRSSFLSARSRASEAMNARQKGCSNNNRQAGATTGPLHGGSAREASLKRRTFENGRVVKEQRVTVERRLFSFSVVKKRKKPCRPNLFNPSQWGRWAAEGGRGGQLRSALSNGECVVGGGLHPSCSLFCLVGAHGTC